MILPEQEAAPVRAVPVAASDLDATLPRRFSLMLLAYWGLAALVLPVMIWDAQAYNLARLRIAQWGGILDNRGWNDYRQIIFPWTFDAIHLPLLSLRAAYALPSYLCLLGVLVVLFRLVRAHWDRARAWWCVLGCLALPTLVYQSTSTKNDVAVVFGVACWVYAVWCHRRAPDVRFLWFGAAGLAFAAGSKTSGLPLAGLCVVWQCWQLRGRWRELRQLALAFAISFLLLGSIETFVNNQREFHFPLGPREQVDESRNRDGLAGATANLVRYTLGNQSLGVDAANPAPPFATWLAKVSLTCVTALGVQDRGMRPAYYNESDSKLQFVKNGSEASSDYSLLGALSLWVGLWLLLSRPVAAPLWRLAAAGWASLVLVAATVAWMPWNARFLLLPFLLLTTATVLWWLEPTPVPAWRTCALAALVGIGAIYAPLHSFSRKPGDLLLALQHRRRLELREQPAMGEVLDDLKRRFPRSDSDARPLLFYCAAFDAWVLPIWNIEGAIVQPVPGQDATQIVAAAEAARPRPTYLLLLGRTWEGAAAAGWTQVQTYQQGAVLYRRNP